MASEKTRGLCSSDETAKLPKQITDKEFSWGLCNTQDKKFGEVQERGKHTVSQLLATIDTSRESRSPVENQGQALADCLNCGSLWNISRSMQNVFLEAEKIFQRQV